MSGSARSAFRNLTIYVISFMCFLALSAEQLPIALTAKFIKVIASSSGVPSVICKDATIAAELTKIGVTLGESKIAWASSPADVKVQAATGKLVICGNLNELPMGGSIAIIEEGGRPAIYLNMANVTKSGVTLGDAILKMGKRI